MTESDRKRFGEIMLGIAETIQGATLSKMGLDIRFEAMKEFTIDEISEAANRLLKTHGFNFMPNVKDFVDAINEAKGILPVEDKAEIEAGKVLSHLRRYGAASSPRFDDPITRQLMNGQWRYGSWARNVLEVDLPWWRREFVRAYKAHAVDACSLPAGGSLQRIAKVTVKSIPSGRKVVNHAI